MASMGQMPNLAANVMSFRSGHRKSYIAVFTLKNKIIALKYTSFLKIIYIILSPYRGPTPPSAFLNGYSISLLMAKRYKEALDAYKVLLDRAQKGEFPPLFQHEGEMPCLKGTIVVIGSTLSFSDLIQSSGSSKNLQYLRNLIYKLSDEHNLYNIAQDSLSENLMNSDTVAIGKGKNRTMILNLLLLPLIYTVIYSILILRKRKKRNG